jgi:hypothetical protein
MSHNADNFPLVVCHPTKCNPHNPRHITSENDKNWKRNWTAERFRTVNWVQNTAFTLRSTIKFNATVTSRLLTESTVTDASGFHRFNRAILLHFYRESCSSNREVTIAFSVIGWDREFLGWLSEYQLLKKSSATRIFYEVSVH